MFHDSPRCHNLGAIPYPHPPGITSGVVPRVFPQVQLRAILGPFLPGFRSRQLSAIIIKDMRLLHADCLSVLSTLPDSSVDLLLVDPPYGVNFQSNRVPTFRKRPKIANDKVPFTSFLPMIPRLLKPTGAAIVFCRWDVLGEWQAEMESCGMVPKSCIVWDKQFHGMGDVYRAFAPCHELALFCPMPGFRFQGKRPNDVLRFPKVAH